jgi:PEP-CTERM motif
MKKYSALILLPCAFALLAAERVEAAPVEWDFIATGCTSFYGGCISGQHYPVTLATFTLPGPDSSGTAVFNGIASASPATYTGDSFVLDFSSNYHPLTPAFTQNNEPFGECEHHGEICQFDLSWSEVAGQLTTLRLFVDAINDSLEGIGHGAFDLSGGEVASDNIYFGAGGAFAGCEGPPCQISGYWVNDALVTAPEPGTLALLASAFGAWGLAGRRTNRNGRNLIRLPHAGLDFFRGWRGGEG